MSMSLSELYKFILTDIDTYVDLFSSIILFINNMEGNLYIYGNIYIISEDNEHYKKVAEIYAKHGIQRYERYADYLMLDQK